MCVRDFLYVINIQMKVVGPLHLHCFIVTKNGLTYLTEKEASVFFWLQKLIILRKCVLYSLA